MYALSGVCGEASESQGLWESLYRAVRIPDTDRECEERDCGEDAEAERASGRNPALYGGSGKRQESEPGNYEAVPACAGKSAGASGTITACKGGTERSRKRSHVNRIESETGSEGKRAGCKSGGEGQSWQREQPSGASDQYA